ncbi:MAG: CHAP domain-containing protein [Acidobacteria bacterium]|nr:CHAP domain-containing protein [Acidobacteriota bacterium]
MTTAAAAAVLGVVTVMTVEYASHPISVMAGQASSHQSFPESPAATASPQTRARIVALAQGQVGYTTAPATSYCNKFSAYWVSGPADCGNANRDQPWCADFAAWAWRMAGVPLVYRFVNGDLNSSSASFYEWGVRHHTWHPLGSGYVPQPGDVAVYGLDVKSLVAQHVAIVASYTPGAAGPNAINGDGSLTGFSRVEYQKNEYNADVSGPATVPLAGYVSPSGSA